MTTDQPTHALLGTNEVLVADSVVTEEEQRVLVAWAERQRREGKLLANPQSPGAYSTPFRSASGELTRFLGAGGSAEQQLVWLPRVDQADPLPDELWSVRARVVERLGLDGLEEDHYKGSLLSYIEPGAGIHQHRDARLKIGTAELPLLRCNVLFTRPEGGGMPVIESNDVDVPDRGMWAFYPTEAVHSATPVRGARFRGVVSFGFLVRVADLLRRRFRIARAFQSQYALDTGDGARRALLDRLRGSARAAGVGDERLDLLSFVISAPGEFDLRDAAEALGWEPAAVWKILRDLQRSKLVESASSARAERGRVVVL